MLSHVHLFVTLWTVACQALLSNISRQEYWSGLPCPPPGDLPDPGIEPTSPVSPALADEFFTTESWRKPQTLVPFTYYFTFQNKTAIIPIVLGAVWLKKKKRSKIPDTQEVLITSS